jgi:hypothetical protein
VIDAAGDAPTCTGSPLLTVDESPGNLLRLYTTLPLGGTDAPFLIDMGSPTSFVYAGIADGGIASCSPNGGHTAISCVPADLPGCPGVGETTPDNSVVRGTLGTDLVARGAALDLGIAQSRFWWWRTPPAPPAGATRVALQYNEGTGALVATGIKLDGRDVRLMVDTGSPHVLILSSTPRPNETVVHTADGNNNPVTLYTSTIQISFGAGSARTVAVDRADTFPDLEGLFAQLGGNVDGLLGLNALGHERIVISKGELAFVMGP